MEDESSRLKSFAFDWEFDEKLMIFTNRREMKCSWKFGKFGIDRNIGDDRRTIHKNLVRAARARHALSKIKK